ncbi:MAG: ABC transporter substrate-binding protein [Rhodospirillaceae bacterium]|nr:ABC transporter substrate-binding protein [Rhodospirillaceae bacterium]
MQHFFKLAGSAAAAILLAATPLRAEVKIGVIASTTGPGASLGIPYRNVYSNLPPSIAGQPAKFIILDDGSDPTQSVKNARKLIDEEKVDVILGPTFTPGCLAVSDAVVQSKVAQICLAPVVVPDAKRPWIFSIPQAVPVMIGGVVEHLKAHGGKTIGYIGFADGWGDLVLKALEATAGPAGIKIVAQERYNRPDTSVNAQVLKVMAARPDAVLIGGSGTPATTPHIALKERGYKGQIYHTHGVVGEQFIRVGGKAVEGAIAPTGPLMAADELPDSNPIKKVALDFFAKLAPAYPQVRNAFSGYSYDAFLLVQAAVPSAMAKAKPGTPQFRQALRDGLEASKEVVGTHAVYNMSPTNHNGVDQRARVLVQIVGGKWKLMK